MSIDVLAVMSDDAERAYDDRIMGGDANDAATALEESKEAIAAVAELIAASEEFSELYGRLWDAVDPEDGGWLSSDSVKDYDAAHDRLSSALAACKESSHG